MKSLNVGAFVVAAILCATPVSLRWTQGNDVPSSSLSAELDSAKAADLGVPVRHRTAYRYRRHYSRLYNPYCDGPYTGGGWNGGTYYGGPWIDLRCYGAVY